MNQLVSFRLCNLSDNDLISLVDRLTDQMYREGGKVLPRHIPARPNSDYDLLVGELCVRFDKSKGAIEFLNELCHLNNCEMEGILPPTPDEWYDTFNRVAEFLNELNK